MTDDTQPTGQPQRGAQPEAADAVVAAPDRARTDDDGDEITTLVEQPAKVMRIGTMIKQLLEEVRQAPLDDASRTRLKEIHRSSIRELEQGLAPELIEELERLSLPFTQDSTPSDAELRIAQAQLEEMRRRALPGAPGVGPGGPVILGPGGQIIPGQRVPQRPEEHDRGTGQYL